MAVFSNLGLLSFSYNYYNFKPLSGVRVANESPRINHLLFADDTMFFSRTSESSCKTLMRILGKYEAVSGQRINASKSSISFGLKTPLEQRERVKSLLGICQEGGVGKYLGLPEHFGRKKKDLFSSIVDKIRQRALSWSNRFLSGAGKLTLLKSVLTAMPSYAMSCFQLPVSLCKRIQSALTRFWWDSKQDKKGMCWVAWQKLVKSKQDGGLGLRDLQNFNAALLGKLGWRILINPTCLLARVVLGKYCHSSSFLSAKCPSSASHGWRSILAGRDLLKKKLGWVIGDGKSISVWNDPWLSSSKALQPMGPPQLHTKDWRVEDLFIQGTVDWDLSKLLDILPSTAAEILSIKPSRLGARDKQVWLGNSSGVYTTKSGYYAAISGPERYDLPAPITHTAGINWQAEVWSIHTSPNVKLFLWKALNGALATGQQLAERCIAANITCCRCGETESILHVLFLCPFAQQVWNLAPFSSSVFPESGTVRDLLVTAMGFTCLPPAGIGTGPLAPWICWNLWKTRNQMVFNDKNWSEAETALKSVLDAKDWLVAQLKLPPLLQIQPAGLRLQDLAKLRRSHVSCTSDGAWRKDLNVAGLGWTSASPSGSSSLRSAVCENVSSPLMAESLACRAAVMDAIDAEATHLLLESDCLQLVGAINSRSVILEIHGIISDIFLCINRFSSFCCRFIPRSANVVADTLAKSCLSVYDQNII